ncbi:MAG: hypothetical protein KAU31_09570, partial [Spirochaetaceae bacterium]|nr:hypothetical protein [Spirochaetaceae bacterium]
MAGWQTVDRATTLVEWLADHRLTIWVAVMIEMTHRGCTRHGRGLFRRRYVDDAFDGRTGVRWRG